MDGKGDYVPEKNASKPVKILKVKEKQYQDVIDLHIFKRTEPGGAQEYCMYLISTQGVLVYYSIEKKEESK